MRSRTDPSLPGRCRACLLRVEWCVCPHLPRLSNRTHVVILRHFKEELKTSNSARLAKLMLERCTLVDVGGSCPPVDPALLSQERTWLLFPPSGVGETTTIQPLPSPLPPVRTLVVPDGTWAQVRRMVRRLPGLAELPRLAMPGPQRASLRLRTPPSDWAMATIEAIAAALDVLESPALGTALDQAFGEFVRRSHRHRGFARPAEPPPQ